MIGRVIKYMRRKRHIKQVEMLEKIGLPQSTISSYESGQNRPDFEMVEEIANLCGFDIVFIDRSDKEMITTKNIERRDIPYLHE